ncbi:MAG: 30S ribosomal protein S3 [Myxococcota bacterium]
MGQKTHPYGFRLGVIKPWKSKWFEDKNYAKWLHEDLALKRAITSKFSHAGIADIEIERAANNVKVVIYTSRAGILIGKRGAGVEQLQRDLQKLTSSNLMAPDIQEIRKAETNAQLVAENIATQLERRVAFRRAMKKAVQTAMKFGVKGIRVYAGGRLGGSEIARSEWYREGRVPLHTLRADIDYGEATAKTTAGAVGVKCWIFKGEVTGAADQQSFQRRTPARRERR